MRPADQSRLEEKTANKKRRREMNLLTDDLRSKLLQNGELRRELARGGKAVADFYPVLKLFMPYGGMTWLLTEIYPDDPDIAFGLCDLGMGFPELGDVRISELESVRGPGGLQIERDLNFSAEKTLSAYAKHARTLRYIEA